MLPPSETKREGGLDGSQLRLESLAFAVALGELRSHTVDAVVELAHHAEVAIPALALGPTQHGELQRNRELRTSPVLPAIDRYTGVLYDALDASTLSESARTFAGKQLLIHSALFGLLGAEDAIPAYRLSHNSRLPGISLRRHWRAAISSILADHPGLVLDLRSDVYGALGPIPASGNARYIRVVTADEQGAKRALSHFNKAGKGRLTRAILEAGVSHESADSLIRWAAGEGFRLENGTAGVLDLVV